MYAYPIPGAVVTPPPPPSDDATLSGLSLSDIDIGAFASGTTGYAASVDNGVANTTVTATTAHAAATVVIADPNGSTIGGQRTVALAEGTNTITVTVTAENGTVTETYTVSVTRAAAAVPLTAEFQSLPPSHAGSGTFTFQIRFSEPIATSDLALRDAEPAGYGRHGGDGAPGRREQPAVGDPHRAGLWCGRGRRTARDHRLQRRGGGLHGRRQAAVQPHRGDDTRAGIVGGGFDRADCEPCDRRDGGSAHADAHGVRGRGTDGGSQHQRERIDAGGECADFSDLRSEREQRDAERGDRGRHSRGGGKRGDRSDRRRRRLCRVGHRGISRGDGRGQRRGDVRGVGGSGRDRGRGDGDADGGDRQRGHLRRRSGHRAGVRGQHGAGDGLHGVARDADAAGGRRLRAGYGDGGGRYGGGGGGKRSRSRRRTTRRRRAPSR